MADITVKLFGVMRVDSATSQLTVSADTVAEVFKSVTAELTRKNAGNKDLLSEIKFNDAIVYINGERCSSRRKKLSSSDEVWLMSPASGG